MKIKDTDTCYICGRKARSSEHAPAKCFFPSDRRSNLIQVPSCEEHNERTSKNDEYLLFIISSHFNNNQIGFDQSVKKGIKTLKRSEALAKTLSENARIASVINSKSVSYNTTAIKIDRQRFDNEIKKIAYALYFYKYKKRWNRSLIIMTPDLYDNTGQVDAFGALILKTKQDLEGSRSELKYEGDNPEVFKYSFMDCCAEDDKILVMVFYEGFEIWIFSQEGTTGPTL